jgi:hypothetical protein
VRQEDGTNAPFLGRLQLQAGSIGRGAVHAATSSSASEFSSSALLLLKKLSQLSGRLGCAPRINLTHFRVFKWYGITRTCRMTSHAA